ncbi:MAG: hypothetical protein ABIR70_16720 [Bryobacteraceae bacterium]
MVRTTAALILFASLTLAQTARTAQLEAALKADPANRPARAELVDYYYRTGSANPAVAIPARRSHILWLIQNAPADPLAGGPSATIDASGHALADPTGFQQASTAWKTQIARRDLPAQALANAAYFFKLSDKGITFNTLERAVALEPANKEICGRLGDAYALAIMGITMINKNGFPQGVDPAQTQSIFANQARIALGTSTNPYVLAKAGYMLSFQGSILRGTGQLAFDTAPLAEAALQRAVSLAPNDREVAEYLTQHRELQRAVQQAKARPSR